MQITIINPNSTESMNQGIFESAARVASRNDKLRMLCVKESPALINSAVDEVNAAYWTLKKAIELSSVTDGYVVACHSDPAVKAIGEATGSLLSVLDLPHFTLPQSMPGHRPFLPFLSNRFREKKHWQIATGLKGGSIRLRPAIQKK